MSNNNNSQRFQAYRACIPFYILYDLDLTSNHLRLYGQIEQMESNPNPKVQATFSYAWMAEQLGISRRNTITVANILKEKGYIEHIKVSHNKWIWRTAKKLIIQEENIVDNSVSSDLGDHLSSDLGDHPKILETKIPKETSTVFSFSSIENSELLELKHLDDERTDSEFLQECNIHMNGGNDDFTPEERFCGLKTILFNQREQNKAFKASTKCRKKFNQDIKNINQNSQKSSLNLEYRKYLSIQKANKQFGYISPDAKDLSFQDWVNK